MFWFGALYSLAFAELVGVFIWAAFDLHNRMIYVIFAQIPILLLTVISKVVRLARHSANTSTEPKQKDAAKLNDARIGKWKSGE